MINSYYGKKTLEYLKDNQLKTDKLDSEYLNEVIDKSYFICNECKLPLHDSNASKVENVCTYCQNPELWKNNLQA